MIIDTEKLNLATAITVTRALTGMSQQELAKKLKMPVPTLCKVERGHIEMPEAYLQKAWQWIERAKYND